MNLWRHGRYVDLWSVVHLLSGALLAFACYGLGYGFWAAALVTLALLVAWECFEWAVGIIEPSPNVGVDLAIGAVGFLLAAYWHYSLGNTFSGTAFGACLLVVALLSAWGFLDFRSRGYY